MRHRVERNEAGNEVHAHEQRGWILFERAGTNHSKDRQSQPAHQHSPNAWEDVAVFAIGLQQLQRTLWREEQAHADEHEVRSQVEQAKSRLIHVRVTLCLDGHSRRKQFPNTVANLAYETEFILSKTLPWRPGVDA